MVLREIKEMLEAWAPAELAWERDNVGLQVGSVQKRIRRILVTLDVTDRVVAEAKQKKIDLIVSHHPLLFHPLKSVDINERRGRLVDALCRQNIALFAMHTNLDFTANGVSIVLAKKLRLEKIRVLRNSLAVDKKIVVYVPHDHVEQVFSAMTFAGAGTIGKYEECSFRAEGIGTFKGSGSSNPYTGKKGRFEQVEEVRLETIVPSWKVTPVLRALKAVHPYEEVAYDLFDLANRREEFGAGAIGEYRADISLREFLGRVRSVLRIPALRYAADAKRKIKRVALCGGGGSDLLPVALHEGADAFITADISYHTFQESDGKIALVDAGHYETEQPVVTEIVKYLKDQAIAKKQPLHVVASALTSNAIQYSLS